MAVPLLIRIVSSSVSIALKSGTIIRDILKTGDLGIIQKGINDLQTEADRSVQRCIVGSLNKQFPNISIIGEENLDPSILVKPDWIVTEQSEDVLKFAKQLPCDLVDIDETDICVWVDPLDGTAEFTQGLLDHVTVLIGISVKGEAKAGVIYQPYYNYNNPHAQTLGRVLWGIVGLGAFGLEKQKAAEGERIITTTRSHMTDAVKNAIDACNPTQVLKVGGAGHKVLLLIEGRAHAYLFASSGCKKWDTCAPEAILHAVGGKLTDLYGKTYSYAAGIEHKNKGGTLATAIKEEHDWYLQRMTDDIRATL